MNRPSKSNNMTHLSLHESCVETQELGLQQSRNRDAHAASEQGTHNMTATTDFVEGGWVVTSLRCATHTRWHVHLSLNGWQVHMHAVQHRAGTSARAPVPRYEDAWS